MSTESSSRKDGLSNPWTAIRPSQSTLMAAHPRRWRLDSSQGDRLLGIWRLPRKRARVDSCGRIVAWAEGRGRGS
ncbi:hypothetical protein RRG08_005746 [Elysia crispata]|uniref:Uncharacterized protein n=1 Tax=Elysia crispata TaxID=231223 RepID=A0AAE0YCL6_9GAST|nr:hypothetical protein RRG08_005746 [Elysia crispata]